MEGSIVLASGIIEAVTKIEKEIGGEIISISRKPINKYIYKAKKNFSDNISLGEATALENDGWEIMSIDKVDDFTEEQLNQITKDNDVYGYNQEQKVNSSWIKKINYNDNKKELEVTTNSDFEYIYMDVPIRIFQDLLAAESAGRYFNRMIKGEFERKE